MVATTPTIPGSEGPTRAPRVLAQRSAWLLAAFWVIGSVAALTMGPESLPFDWPHQPGASVGSQLVVAWGSLAVALGLIGVTYLITRHRAVPDVADRVPSRAVAARETGLLVGYGVLVQLGGLALGQALGQRAISLHLPGAIYGTSSPISPWQAVVWASYNLVFFAVVPYLFFRGRGYSNSALGLRSSNRANDALLIVVIVVLESAVELSALGGPLFALGGRQLLLAAPLSFVLNLVGTVLPIMIFLYAILLPRLLKLTGSVPTTIVLGGVAYALMHSFEAWAIYDSLGGAALSILFLAFQYVPPGMVKSALTLRTGNAWVHAWAYHAIAPHSHIDAPNIADIFRLR